MLVGQTQCCGGGTSSTTMRETEFQPDAASAFPYPLQFPTKKPTRIVPLPILPQ